jgi:hypothetical protein
MTKYTDVMVKALESRESWDYAAAEAFATANGLSTRSVISKLKHLGLNYVPRPAAARKTDGVRKSDVVADIARALSVNADVLAGLAKADRKALDALRDAVAS